MWMFLIWIKSFKIQVPADLTTIISYSHYLFRLELNWENYFEAESGLEIFK